MTGGWAGGVGIGRFICFAVPVLVAFAYEVDWDEEEEGGCPNIIGGFPDDPVESLPLVLEDIPFVGF